jgi:hypothetical protein
MTSWRLLITPAARGAWNMAVDEAILELAMLVNPLRIFLPILILCMSVGLLWGIPIVIAGR